jgi:hypothetical protein
MEDLVVPGRKIVFWGRYYCCRKAHTETERAPKVLGSKYIKFIKHAGNNSADLSPKAEL